MAAVAEAGAGRGAGLAAEAASAVDAGSHTYPGDGAGREAVAAWMAARARAAGLPGELPVMASLVESGLRNVDHGDRDSLGFFQMRASIWDRGAYAGYARHPELQLKWFIDHALAVKRSQVAAGAEDFGSDPQSWGNWIADVERPAAEYRYRYGDQLDAAKQILAGRGRSGAQV